MRKIIPANPRGGVAPPPAARELWVWCVLQSREVGVCKIADIGADGRARFAIFKDMAAAAGHVLDRGGVFAR